MAYQIVSDQLKVTFDRAKRRYDQRVRAVHFPLHSYVWFYCPRLTAGRGRKFKKLTDGPYRIVRILNDVNYVIQKVPGSRLQVCHVDRLLRYEGELPQVWVKYDKENAGVASVPAMPESRTGPEPDQVPSPELVGNEDPSTSIPRRRLHKRTRRFHVQATQPTRNNKPTRFEKSKYWSKNQTIHQIGHVSNFRRNADNRPIT